MKATDFVKKYDLEMAKHAVFNMPKDWSECYLKESNLEYFKSPPSVSDWVCMNDLKQIVEAFELVEKFGGMTLAKDKIKGKTDFNLTAMEGYLKQAINLVEQCQ